MVDQEKETEITWAMVEAGLDEEFLDRIAHELAEWEPSGELYGEFARRLAVLFYKQML